MKDLVIIRGAGDIATGVMHKLYQCGFSIIAIELKKPTAIRRWVSFSEAIYEDKYRVEDVNAFYSKSINEIEDNIKKGIAIVTNEVLIKSIVNQFTVYVDITLRKDNIKDAIKAPIMIGVGPGFVAGKNVHAVIESKRGHDLGRVIYTGSAKADTKTPGNIGGYTIERVIKSPIDGVITVQKTIGEKCNKDDVVATVSGIEVRASLAGIIRGMIRSETIVHKGMKIGDIDPRVDEIENCKTISDKARCIAGGVLEAIMHLKGEKNE